MARIVKEADERRAEILDCAQKFFYTKGYEQTSVRDIIDDIGVAKGTFYHYFTSKQALLEALIDRLTEQALAITQPIIEDDQLNAVEKLTHYYGQAVNWKTENKALFLPLLHVLYLDENIVLRNKLKEFTIMRITPDFTRVIEQGIAEELFSVTYPVETAVIILSMTFHFSEQLGRLLLEAHIRPEPLAEVTRIIGAHEEALTRILGAPAGSIQVTSVEQMQEWLEAMG